MNGKRAFMIAWLMVLATLLLPFSAVAAEKIGEVSRVQGTVQIFREGQALPITVARGMEVYRQDRVKTAANSYLRIELTDESILSLGEKAQMNLAEYEYDPGAEKRNASFDMAAGKIRVFTKSLAKLKSNSFKIKTPTAVVGVRGTLFMVWVLSDTLTRVTCLDNVVEVFNLMRPDEVILLNPNDTTDVRAQQAPTPPEKISVDLQEQVNMGQDLGFREVPKPPAAPAPVAPTLSVPTPSGTSGVPESDAPSTYRTPEVINVPAPTVQPFANPPGQPPTD